MTDQLTSTGRWFVRKDGVLFICVEDLIKDYQVLKEQNLNPPIDVVIAGLEASRDIAKNAYDKLKVNKKDNDQGDSFPQN